MQRMIGTVALLLALAGASVPAAASGNSTLRNFNGEQLHCLALNIYFEARGEPLLGKIAVGHVVLNRIADSRFPSDACSVIRQGGETKLHRCQFSWWCDGRSDRPRHEAAWRDAIFVALLITSGATKDPTGGALWYHADYVDPFWSREKLRYAKIGKHIFYVAPKLHADASTRHGSGT